MMLGDYLMEEWEQTVPTLPVGREVSPQNKILPVCVRIPAGLTACFGESTCYHKETFLQVKAVKQ